MFLFSAVSIKKNLKPLKQDPSPYNLCPLFSWPLQHYATKENGGWALYGCIGIYLHCARRHFLTVTGEANTYFFKELFLKSNAKLWLKWGVDSGTSFLVQLWSFISIQTYTRPALPVLGFCRAELQSACNQNAQVSSTIQFIFFLSLHELRPHMADLLFSKPIPYLTSLIRMKRNWNLEFLFKQ